MPNRSNPASAAIAAVLAAVFAPFAIFVGAAGAIDDTGPMRPVFALLFASGLMMLFGGIQTIVKWRRDVREEAEHKNAIRAAVGLPPAPRNPPPPPLPGLPPAPPAREERMEAMQAAAVSAPAGPLSQPLPAQTAREAGNPTRTLPSGEPVLAHWTYTADEWRTYTQAEWRYRFWEAVVVGGGITVLAYFISRGEMGSGALPFGLAFGAIFFVGRLMMASSARQANESAPGEAFITPTAVLLNGKYHVLADERIRFQGVKHDRAAKPPVLEFTVGWDTRGGPTNEQIRVPVPAGREAEADAIVAALATGWGPHPAA